ncbi:uncharacterized protein LOC129304172 [Prosopis cineraria]|uniref:uncharacterized protein LOC129304172 n=1 Tax=Prosopis cineraria TaxID=364024 RepID=UPI00240EA3DE|nr:uncharacterized protein LOC129304172 [Prosopis cineraria]
MKGEDPSARTAMTKRENSEDGFVGNRHYRFWWVIIAIVLLALWSMFTGSITLRLSAANILRFSYDSGSRILDDIDVLELEEREKTVRRMWDVYTHSAANRLPQFWSEAFEAAYEHLASEVDGVREAAVSEIAKMSLHSSNSEQLPPLQPNNSTTRVSRKIKQGARKSVDNIKAANI